MTKQLYTAEALTPAEQPSGTMDNILILRIGDEGNVAVNVVRTQGKLLMTLYSSGIDSDYNRMRKRWADNSAGLNTGDLAYVDDILCKVTAVFGYHADCGVLEEVDDGPSLAEFRRTVLQAGNPAYTGDGNDKVFTDSLLNRIMENTGKSVEDIIEEIEAQKTPILS